MAFTAQTDAGDASANSYITIDFADAYHLDRDNTDWAAATTANKEFALVNSTDYLEQAYEIRFVGTRATTSGLHFPLDDTEVYTYDNNGFLVSGVPYGVKVATAELALLALTTDLLPNASAETEVTSVTESVGPISRSTSYEVGATLIPKYPRITRFLKPLLTPPSIIRK